MSKRAEEMRDGFAVRKDTFELPPDFRNLTLKGDRVAAICDMFINSGFTIEMITDRFQEDDGRIIRTLIRHGVVAERRIAFSPVPAGQERRSRLPAWAEM